MKTKKMIELIDIISVEEADDSTKEDVDLKHVVILMLTYGEVFVAGRYETYKKKWMDYKERVNKNSAFINTGKN